MSDRWIVERYDEQSGVWVWVGLGSGAFEILLEAPREEASTRGKALQQKYRERIYRIRDRATDDIIMAHIL
jgi:hypothetical protein